MSMPEKGFFQGFSLVAASVMLALAVSAPTMAKEVSGKVVAVYHEKVTVNNKVLDKISSTVRSCEPGNPFVTVNYSPGALSDDNAYGYIYNHLLNAARAAVTKSQYINSVSGHVTFTTNDSNTVSKTKFWGYNWECGRSLDGPAAAGGGFGGGTTPTAAKPQQPPAPGQAPPPQPAGGAGGAFGRRFGF